MELTYLWVFLSYFGDIAYWLGFTISFLMIYPFLSRRDKEKQKWILLYLLPAVLLSYISSFFLKLAFKVPRACMGLSYCPKTYAFPSGHATIALAFPTITFFFFRRNPKVYLPLFLLSFLICYSRIALHVHTIFDVVGGGLLGIIVSVIWYFFFKRIESGKDRLRFYFRKLIHLGSAFILFLYLNVGKNYAIAAVFSLMFLFLISEIFRLKKVYFPILHEISTFCKKKEEKGFLLEPFLFILSLCLLLFFPPNFFLAGSLPLLIGDAFAGLIGYAFGRHKLPYNRTKTVEGTVGFFVSTFTAFLLFFNLKVSLFLSIFSTLWESSLRKYENFLLPTGCAAFYTLLSTWMSF
jgi:dolichol kinase/membrane-associated phospholipid phosphatase